MLPEGSAADRALHGITGGGRDNPPMHLIVPFAAPLPEEGRAAARTLARPVLAALRDRLVEQARDDGDEWSLSPA